VTSVDIVAIGGGGVASADIETPNAPVNSWNVPADQATHSFQYASGIVFPGGYTFNKTVGFLNVTGMWLRGYLTPM
jgi:hypothetical protein